MQNLRVQLKEIARRGHAIFDEKIGPMLTSKDKGKYVAIDIVSSDYEMARTRLLAFQRLHARIPDCEAFMIRVGHRAAVKFGRHVRTAKP